MYGGSNTACFTEHATRFEISRASDSHPRTFKAEYGLYCIDEFDINVMYYVTYNMHNICGICYVVMVRGILTNECPCSEL